MGREENLQVFLDTERLVKENTKLIDAVSKSSAGQILIPEKMRVEESMPSYKDNMNRQSGCCSQSCQGCYNKLS